MRYMFAAVVFMCAIAASATAQEIQGSGSTFVHLVMTKWVEAYEKTVGAHVMYQPIGSASGITEIRQGIVDFAVSEAPLDDAQLLRDGLVQFPLVIGAIVPVVNLDGISAGQLRVTGALLADIYLGKVTNWNDPALAALNPDLKLPNLAILVVHRSDGSGSSFVWADYLSKNSNEWKARVGAKTQVKWPTGVGVKHNDGVAAAVRRFPGAVGYLDYPYATRAKMAYALVRNQAGNFTVPGMESFQAATTGVDWMRQRDFAVSLTDAPAVDAYPIMAISFALIHKYPKDPGHAREMRAFFRWALENGHDMARSHEYLPLPSLLVEQVEGYWEAETR